MNKSILILAVVSVLVNMGLIYLFLIKGETKESEDLRTEITMTADHKEFVFVEMREFLESVQQINAGILEGKPEKIINAGKKSGSSVIAYAPQGLLKTLPSGFKALGFSTHDIFDEIAKSAEQNYDEKQTQKQLGTLLNNCVACHRAYKISVTENE